MRLSSAGIKTTKKNRWESSHKIVVQMGGRGSAKTKHNYVRLMRAALALHTKTNSHELIPATVSGIKTIIGRQSECPLNQI